MSTKFVTDQAILDAIRAYQAEHGWAPTIRELANIVGLFSTATMHARLSTLEARGRIVRGEPGQQAGALRLV